MKQLTRRRLIIAMSSMTAAALPSLSAAQAWPAKPIRVIVPYPPGSITDNVARAMGTALSGALNAPVIVENRAGAGGTLGIDAVAKAAPDGYTIGFSAISPLTISPHLMKVAYDPARDFVPIASVMYSPIVLAATPAFAGNSFKDLTDASRAKPGSVRWSTSGAGSAGHIMLEQIQTGAKVQITHIPYKGGGGQQLTDALSGQFDVICTNLNGPLLQHIKAGKLRPLAVGAATRASALPQVPTFAELGFAPANLVSVLGFLAPAKTPDAILARLNGEINKALQLPSIRSMLLDANNVPTGGTAAEFARHIASESESFRAVIQAAAIKVD